MTNKENKKINLRFAKIKVVKYLQYDIDESKYSDIPEVEFNTSLNIRVIPDEEQILFKLDINTKVLDDKEDFSDLTVENYFDIKPFNEVILKNNDSNTYSIPDGLIQNLAGMAISTVRGVLSEKLKGTIIQSHVYPVVNLSFLKNQELKTLESK